MFIEVPLFSETSPALKNSWLRACNAIDFRCQLKLLKAINRFSFDVADSLIIIPRSVSMSWVSNFLFGICMVSKKKKAKIEGFDCFISSILIYVNPIKFGALLISTRFILVPLIFAQLCNSYIRARIIFARWQNLYFHVSLFMTENFQIENRSWMLTNKTGV